MICPPSPSLNNEITKSLCSGGWAGGLGGKGATPPENKARASLRENRARMNEPHKEYIWRRNSALQEESARTQSGIRRTTFWRSPGAARRRRRTESPGLGAGAGAARSPIPTRPGLGAARAGPGEVVVGGGGGAGAGCARLPGGAGRGRVAEGGSAPPRSPGAPARHSTARRSLAGVAVGAPEAPSPAPCPRRAARVPGAGHGEGLPAAGAWAAGSAGAAGGRPAEGTPLAAAGRGLDRGCHGSRSPGPEPHARLPLGSRGALGVLQVD